MAEGFQCHRHHSAMMVWEVLRWYQSPLDCLLHGCQMAELGEALSLTAERELAGLSRCTMSALLQSLYLFRADLAAASDEELLWCTGIGQARLREIRAWLADGEGEKHG